MSFTAAPWSPRSGGRSLRWWVALTILVWHVYGIVSVAQTLIADRVMRGEGWAPAPEYHARVLLGSGSEVWFRILLTPLIVVYVIGVTRLTRQWAVRALLIAAGGLASVFLAAAKASWDARTIFGRDMDYAILVASGFDYNLLVFVATALIFLLWRSGVSRIEEAKRMSELKGRLTSAELAALKMQLQPHFLFNTLNSISAMIHSRPDAADRMIGDLGDLLRKTLNEGSRHEVPLRQEIETLGSYLAIQRERFPRSLDVQVDIDPEALSAKVPHFILQPLVENAIQHGRNGSRCLRVRVRGWLRGDRVWLEVADDGKGFGPGGPGRPTGVGLSNTVERLRQLYSGDHELELGDSEEGGAIVRLSVPLRRPNG